MATVTQRDQIVFRVLTRMASVLLADDALRGWSWLRRTGIASCGVEEEALAQYTTATLSGIITDSSGQTVPGASVTIENTGTGLVSGYTTGKDGCYFFPRSPRGDLSSSDRKERLRHLQSGWHYALCQP